MAAPHDRDDVYQELGGRSNKRIAEMVGVAFACTVLCSSAFVLGRFSTRSALVHEPSIAQVAAAGNGTAALWKPRMLPIYSDEPLGKNIIRRFDLYLMNGAAFDTGDSKVRQVGQWLAQDFKYETVGFGTSFSLRGWCNSGELSQFHKAFPTTSFSQMLFFGDDKHATTTSYGNVHWMHDLFGVPAPKKWMYFRVTDFYHIRKTSALEGLVDYNFMLIDFADLFRRAGRPVLAPAALPEGLVLPPSVNDGVPAPLSVVAKGRDAVSAKAASAGALTDGWAGEALPTKWWHSDLTFYGPGGIGLARGATQYHEHVILPFRAAFANRSVETRFFFCEGNYCGAFGALVGRHVGAWVGQAASNALVSIRFAMHWRVVDGKIKEGWAIFDFPGFLSQLGLDFFALARDKTPQHH